MAPQRIKSIISFTRWTSWFPDCRIFICSDNDSAQDSDHYCAESPFVLGSFRTLITQSIFTEAISGGLFRTALTASWKHPPEPWLAISELCPCGALQRTRLENPPNEDWLMGNKTRAAGSSLVESYPATEKEQHAHRGSLQRKPKASCTSCWSSIREKASKPFAIAMAMWSVVSRAAQTDGKNISSSSPTIPHWPDTPGSCTDPLLQLYPLLPRRL